MLRLSRPTRSADTSVGATTAPASVAENPAISYLSDLLKDAREELSRVDSKAALLLAGVGVVAGALLAGILNGRWTPLSLDSRVGWVWWLGLGAASVGIFAIAAAVYPYTGRAAALHAGPPLYYGDVAAYKDIDAFRKAIADTPSAQDRLVDQTFQISKIVQRKYTLLRRGLLLLLLAVMACVSAVVINVPLSR
jgi:MFS family permease